MLLNLPGFRLNPAPIVGDVLIVVAGQSNTRSFGTTGSDVPGDLEGMGASVQIWNTFTQTFQTYDAGTNSDTWTSGAGTPQKWGPEASFAKDFIAANPGVTLYIVKLGVDSSALAAGVGDDWSEDSTGELYDDLTTELAAAKTASGISDVAAILWMQGEEDAEDITEATNYGVNLASFISATRIDWGDTSTEFILGRIAPTNSKANASTVRAFHSRAALDVVDVQAIDMDGFSFDVDTYHLLPAGVRSLGEAMFDAFAGTYAGVPVRFGSLNVDKNASVTLTNNGMTAEGGGVSSSALQLARSDHLLGVRKAYMEFEINLKTANLSVGMGKGVATNSYWGFLSDSVGYVVSGAVFKNAIQIATYATYTAGDIIMMAYDGATGKVWFGKNGTWNGDPAADTGQAATLSVSSATSLPRFGAALRRSGDKVTLVAAAADWTYSPPSGFGAL